MPRTKKSCPCGSGNPFDECCGAGKVLSSLEQARWRRAGQYLRRRLGEFADRPSFAWDTARAQDLYLGSLDKRLFDSDDDFSMERCFEWFIFDYKLSNGRTVIEMFRQEHAHTLNHLETALLQDWISSCISLYQVTGVTPGQGFSVRNLLYREEVSVRDLNASAEIEVGNILLIRVLKVGEEYEFSTSGLALPGECKGLLLKKLRQERRDFFHNNKARDRGWRSYLKEQGHKMNALVMDLGSNNPSAAKGSAARGGERKDILSVNNWQHVLETIKTSEQFGLIGELKDSSGAFRQAAAAVFSEPRGQKKQGEFIAAEQSTQYEILNNNDSILRSVLGHLTLTPAFMIITAGTPELLSECKRVAKWFFQDAVEEKVRGKYERDISGEGESYSWPTPRYAIVAGSVREGLESLGFNPKQLKGALKLWFDYCSKERPSIRKTAVWAATVIYTFTRLEMKNRLKQEELAWRYGVASSTISSRFRLLCKSLELKAYDKRYSTKKPPLSGPPELTGLSPDS